MIYFCSEEGVDGGPVKIGLTRVRADEDWRHSIAFRLSALQTSTPRVLVVTSAMEGTDVEERALHLRFALAWVIGEWFSRTPELEELMQANRVEPIHYLGFDERRVPPCPPSEERRILGIVSEEGLEQELRLPSGYLRKLRRRGYGPPFVRATKSVYVYRWEDVDAWMLSIRVVPAHYDDWKPTHAAPKSVDLTVSSTLTIEEQGR